MSIYSERLNKLADFVEPLPAEKFDFTRYVAESDGECGTVCCAIGWCPAVFPGEWEWTGDMESIALSGGPVRAYSVMADAMRFFSLTYEEVSQAFVPFATSNIVVGLLIEKELKEQTANAEDFGYCRRNATGKQVAKNLRRVATIVEARG